MGTKVAVFLGGLIITLGISTFFRCWILYKKYKKRNQALDKQDRELDVQVHAYNESKTDPDASMVAIRHQYHQHIKRKRIGSL